MKIKPLEMQPAVWDRLVKIIDHQKVGSAYLFCGPQGAGKEALALEFAACLNNLSTSQEGLHPLQHENVKLIVPLPSGTSKSKSGNVLQSLSKEQFAELSEATEKKILDPFFKIAMDKAFRIRIDSIRELRRTIFLKSYTGGKKVCLIFDAHLLSMGQGESANALLKLLEEPPPDTVFILVSDKVSEFLPTILSRCQHIQFPPLSDEMISQLLLERGAQESNLEFICYIAEGNFYQAQVLAKYSPEELNALLYKLISTILKPKTETWRSFIQEYSRKASSSPKEFYLHIYLLRMWFREVSRRKMGVTGNTYSKKIDELCDYFNRKFQHADIPRIDSVLEQVTLAPARHLYMSLVLSTMLIKIQRALN